MGMFFAWATGEGIICWRWAKAKAPPTPGALLLPTALYLSLAVLSEYRPARPVAVAFAWSVNLAILLQVVGKVPAQATGWPPPQIPFTQIWPGSPSASASSGSGTTTGSSSGVGGGLSGGQVSPNVGKGLSG